MALQSHSHDFQQQQEKNEDGLTTWQTIELMSQAAMSYSGTKEPLPFVQEITAKVGSTISFVFSLYLKVSTSQPPSLIVTFRR